MTSEPTDEIVAAHKAWLDAAAARDEASLNALIADGLVYRHASGRVQTKAEVISDVSERGRRPVVESLDVRRFGDTAVVSGVQPVDPQQPGSIEVQLLLVWSKLDGRWQLVARQATMPRVVS
ncbi:MAG: nuclear transport factor 2 family protein [Dehalococcoidia bacterium]